MTDDCTKKCMESIVHLQGEVLKLANLVERLTIAVTDQQMRLNNLATTTIPPVVIDVDREIL